MPRHRLVSTISVAVATIWAASVTAQPLAPSAPAPALSEVAGPMWGDAGRVLAACDAVARGAEAHVAAFIAADARGTDEDLGILNRLFLELDRVRSTAELIAVVHPEHSVRGAAEVCTQALGKVDAELVRHPTLYKVLSSVDGARASPGARRFVTKLKQRFVRAGVDRDPATRARLAVLDARMVRLRQDYSRRIRESTRWIAVPRAGLDGLPKDFVANHVADHEGKVELTTRYPDYFPVLTYAHDESVRRDLYREFLNRAYPENDRTLAALLAARHEYATLLGFDSWAAYQAQGKMIGSARAVRGFVTDLQSVLRPRMQKELDELLALKQQDDRRARAVEVWDRFYYVERLRQERYGYDARDVRAYFTYDHVVTGLLDLFGELFGLRFEREVGVRTWHHSVAVYNAYDGDWLLGRFYLDMHPRPDKYGHDAFFGLGLDRVDGRLPEAALVANLPDPRRTQGPALLDHAQVRTLFHEFGHLVHYLLATSSTWSNQAGLSVELDFVEAPALLFEAFAWRPEVLQRFARHHATGRPIPKALVERMRAASELGRAVEIMRQLHYTALSAELHGMDPRGVDLARFAQGVHDRHSPFPYPEGTHGYASFGHLDEFSSEYYVYQWSLSLARDMATGFEAGGFVDRAVARRFADTVLRPGGAKPAEALVSEFLGRAPSHATYRAWLSGR